MNKHVLLVSSLLGSAQAACTADTVTTPQSADETCADATCQAYRGAQTVTQSGYTC
jgi:hypothetical protein